MDRAALENTSTLVNSRKTKPGLRWARYILDRLRLGQSSTRFDFLYNREAHYVEQPFTWEALERHAPGWSKRIQEESIRYGYSAADDMVAAGLAPAESKDVKHCAVQPV